MPSCATDRTLRIVRGTHATIRVTVYDGDGELLDLTGHDVSFRVKVAIGDAAAVIAKAVGTGVTLLAQTGDTLAQADIELVPGDTAALAPGVLVYAVNVTEPAPGFEIRNVIRPSDFVLYAEV